MRDEHKVRKNPYDIRTWTIHVVSLEKFLKKRIRHFSISMIFGVAHIILAGLCAGYGPENITGSTTIYTILFWYSLFCAVTNIIMFRKYGIEIPDWKDIRKQQNSGESEFEETN